jgi:hypothetical protein
MLRLAAGGFFMQALRLPLPQSRTVGAAWQPLLSAAAVPALRALALLKPRRLAAPRDKQQSAAGKPECRGQLQESGAEPDESAAERHPSRLQREAVCDMGFRRVPSNDPERMMAGRMMFT